MSAPDRFKRNFWVNPERLSKARETKNKDFFLELSPYDMPRVIRSEYSPQSRQLTLDFEYIDHERPVKATTENQVQVLVGKHTGKVIRVIMPISELPMLPEAVVRLRDNAISAIRCSWPSTASGVMNRRVSEEILYDDFSDLAPDLLGWEIKPG